jgi:hypothetical protein
MGVREIVSMSLPSTSPLAKNYGRLPMARVYNDREMVRAVRQP